MAVERLVGPPRKLVKFASLVIGLLMAGGTVANILYAQYLLALASAIISAWALMVFADALKADFAATVGAVRDTEADDGDG